MIAWSTPGAAVLAVAGASGGFGMAEATGAFIVCARADHRWSARPAGSSASMDRIPMPLAGALLAGVLARFGLDAFAGARARVRRWCSRCCSPTWSAGAGGRATRCVGVLAGRHRRRGRRRAGCTLGGVQWALDRCRCSPTPEFTWRATVSLALPLFVVTMASQNLPGVAAIRAAGYEHADLEDHRR